MNQTYFIPLKLLTLGVKKNGWGKACDQWRPMYNHNFICLDDLFNVIVNSWPMVLHKTKIDIKLPIFLLTLLVFRRKKDRKLKNIQIDSKKTKILNIKNKI
jgi:hypothetical protein